jgi:ATP-dependent DNA helicase PIF1
MAPELAFFPCGSFWIRRPERPSWEIHKIQYNLLLQEVFYLSFSDQKVFNYASQKKSFSGNEPSGMPPHYLRLKIGSSIMLLRNLDAPRLCNGTRLCVKTLMPHVIEATIMTGCAKGEDVFIPRIPLLPTDLPFPFKRLQFPVRLAFAMSINKSQGQSLKVAGVNLETPCFSHGQLYVACSRVGTGKNLYVLAPDGKTKNVVYRTALQ